MLVIPSDPLVIDHFENKLSVLLEEKSKNKNQIKDFVLPIMYEFYEEKDIYYERQFNRNLFLNQGIKRSYLICYELLCEMLWKRMDIIIPDFKPVHTKKIRVRASKTWLQPFVDIKNSINHSSHFKASKNVNSLMTIAHGSRMSAFLGSRMGENGRGSFDVSFSIDQSIIDTYSVRKIIGIVDSNKKICQKIPINKESFDKVREAKGNGAPSENPNQS